MRTIQEAILNERDREVVEAAASALWAALPVHRVVLFGSTARGQRGAESDIDLLVITARPLTPQESDSIIPILYPLQLEYAIPISTREVTSDEWEHGPYRVLPIRREIDHDGLAA